MRDYTKEYPVLTVLRHGTTNLNRGVTSLFRGWLDDNTTQLDKQGIEDARAAGTWLLRSGLPIAAIVSSDLGRAKETAGIVADILGIKPENIIFDKRLRTMDVGDLEGTPQNDDVVDAYFKDKNKKLPGSTESVAIFEKRLEGMLHHLLEAAKQLHGTVLVITHGAVTGWLNSLFKQGDENGYFSKHYEGAVMPGGIGFFTNDGFVPMKNKRDNAGGFTILKDGTLASGFVTDEQNRPPRECWNCKAFVRDPNIGTGGCSKLPVRYDPELQKRKQTDGTIAVGDRDCCDYFQNKTST